MWVCLALQRDVWGLVCILVGKFLVSRTVKWINLPDRLILNLIIVQVPQISISVRRGMWAASLLDVILVLCLGLIHDSRSANFVNIYIAFLSFQAICVCVRALIWRISFVLLRHVYLKWVCWWHFCILMTFLYFLSSWYTTTTALALAIFAIWVLAGTGQSLCVQGLARHLYD